MSRRGITTAETAIIVLVLIAIVVSAGVFAYVMGLAGLPGKIEELSSTTAELASAEKELAGVVADLGKAVGAYAERIAAIEKRIAAVEEATKPLPPKPLIIGTTDKITILDPANTYDFFTWEIFLNIGEGLLKYKPGTTELEPGLAESYEVSRDGLTYTFKLRKGLKFTDGTPLDASAVKWSIDRVMRLKGLPSGLVLQFVKEVKVVDTYTVAIELLGPCAYFPSVLGMAPCYYPVSPKAYPADEFKDSTVSIGHYMVKSWVRDVELVLKANPDYYGEPPKSETVVVKFFKDATTMRLALEMGEIDVAWKTLRPVDFIDLKKRGGLLTIESPGLEIRYIVLNTKLAPFNDLRVRKAVAAAINREAICERVFMGLKTSLYSMVPKGMWSHIDIFKGLYGEHNTKLAKELLTEAGYSEANKLKIELWYTPTHYGDTEADVAAMLKESLEETGMATVELKSAEWATYLPWGLSGKVFTIFLLGWYPDFIDPDNYLLTFLHSTKGIFGTAGGSNYTNPEMDRVLEEAMVGLTIEERTALYEQAQRMLGEDCPHVPMFQGTMYTVTQPNVRGVILDPLNLMRYYLIYKV